MHCKIGDLLPVFNQFGEETVFIRNVYAYPNGGIAYGFYSDNAGRNLLKDCNCADCAPLHEERKATGKHYIGDAEKGVLVVLN